MGSHGGDTRSGERRRPSHHFGWPATAKGPALSGYDLRHRRRPPPVASAKPWLTKGKAGKGLRASNRDKRRRRRSRRSLGGRPGHPEAPPPPRGVLLDGSGATAREGASSRRREWSLRTPVRQRRELHENAANGSCRTGGVSLCSRLRRRRPVADPSIENLDRHAGSHRTSGRRSLTLLVCVRKGCVGGGLRCCAFVWCGVCGLRLACS